MLTNALLCLVVASTDGDTLKARCDERGSYEQNTVRISAIDAPELRLAFGKRSKQHLSDLAFQELATITPGPRTNTGARSAMWSAKVGTWP